MLISIKYIYYQFTGLEDNPILFKCWKVRVRKYFWGTIGFSCGARKKSRSAPLRQSSVCRCGGDPPVGGSPLGGDPPRGGPPLLSKTDFFEKFEKEDALSRPYAHFGPQKPCLWGGTQNDRFWPFLGVLGGTPILNPI
jgi:hypothetical protein